MFYILLDVRLLSLSNIYPTALGV